MPETTRYMRRGGMADPRNRVWHSTAYRKLRLLVFERDDYRCRYCGRQLSRSSTAPKSERPTCHHRVPVMADPSQALELDLMATACAPCHGRIDASRPRPNARGRRRRHSRVDAPILEGGRSRAVTGRAAHAGATSREFAVGEKSRASRFLDTVA